MSTRSFTVEDAISFAAKAHKGQTYDRGMPYIYHPLKVMQRVRDAGYGAEQQIVAVLHDTIEDTGATYETLFNLTGSSSIAQAVNVLSRKGDETYEQFIERIISTPLSSLTVPVKRADIQENLAHGAVNPLPEPRRTKLTTRYEAALIRLEGLN